MKQSVTSRAGATWKRY